MWKGPEEKQEPKINLPKLEEPHTFGLFSTRRDREGDAQDLHLSSLELDFSPTVYGHGAAELVAEEGFKGFKRILFSIYQPTPRLFHFSME